MKPKTNVLQAKTGRTIRVGIVSRFCVLLIMLILSTIALTASAQISTATLFGNVTDGTGASIPNASVIITQAETGFTRSLVTKEDGSYRADFLPIGSYKVKVIASGFKTLDREGVTLNVTEEARLDLPLQIGGGTEVVEVTAEVPLINTGNSILGRVVDNKEIDNLPLVDRNVYTLLDLTAGVQNNSNVNPLGYPEQHVTINGSTDSGVGQVAYYLDGGSNMTGIRNTGNPLPNPDAIKEFAVQTNNFSAQFGRSSGGVVTVLTKSGGNDFHGSLFEFNRERNFNATTHNTNTKVPYNQHRFGGTVGGPIYRDKAFFFGSYAGFRYISSNILTTTVPSAAMRTGDFSENLPTGTLLTGAAACAKSVVSTSTKFYVCNPNTRTAYAGNIVPQADLDPTILKIFAAGLIGLPNPSQTGDSAYTRRDLQRFTNRTDEYLAKSDVQLTAKQRLTLSYFHQTGSQLLNPAGNNINNWTTHNYNFLQHNANVQHTWTVSNSTVNQLFLGYTRLLGGRVAAPAETLAAYGSTLNVQGAPSRSQIAVSGWFTAGNAITGPVTGANVYLLRDVVSTTHGKHTLFLGAEGDLEKDAQQVELNNYGVFSFTQASAGTAARTSAAISDLFFGRPNTFNQDSPVYANANYFNYGAFFQDDWRIHPRLTVNLGVRYDVQTAPLDTARRTLNFKAGVQSGVIPSAPLGLQFPGDPGVPEGGAATEYNHISPRVGFAWNPYGDGKTVIHGAAGIFFGTVSGNEFEYPSNNQPYAVRAQYKKVISVADPYKSDPSEFCATTNCTVGTSPYPYVYDPKNPRFIKPSQIISFDPKSRWPEIYQINFGFAQQLTRGLALTANYVASLSRELPIFYDANYPIYTAGATTSTTDNRRPLNASLPGGSANPTYSNVYVIQSSESSNYNGLQVTVEQRLTHNFSIKGFYTWSKTLASAALDSAGNTGNNAATAYEDPNQRQLDRQRSDFDQRHVSVISFVYKPSYAFENRLVRTVVNGWTVTSIIRMQSGKPFTITTGTDVNADANNNDRPNLSGIGTPRITDNGSSRVAMENNWVSASYFCTNSGSTCPGAGPLGIDGTVRANLLDAPGYRNIDGALFRDFTLHDRYTLQLRGEATNVFNLTNLPAPSATLNSPTTFGHINGSIANGNRILQIGARLLF
jgi:hypothetical protein